MAVIGWICRDSAMTTSAFPCLSAHYGRFQKVRIAGQRAFHDDHIAGYTAACNADSLCETALHGTSLRRPAVDLAADLRIYRHVLIIERAWTLRPTIYPDYPSAGLVR